jgi:hypothetical protein
VVLRIPGTDVLPGPLPFIVGKSGWPDNEERVAEDCLTFGQSSLYLNNNPSRFPINRLPDWVLQRKSKEEETNERR